MRAILLILILATAALIAAFATGYVRISQTRRAEVPQVEASGGAIRASGGQSPSFDVQTGSVEVGSKQTNVSVPKIEVKQDQRSVKVPVVEVRRPSEAQQNTSR
jgi:hypothetical protein